MSKKRIEDDLGGEEGKATEEAPPVEAPPADSPIAEPITVPSNPDPEPPPIQEYPKMLYVGPYRQQFTVYTAEEEARVLAECALEYSKREEPADKKGKR